MRLIIVVGPNRVRVQVDEAAVVVENCAMLNQKIENE